MKLIPTFEPLLSLRSKVDFYFVNRYYVSRGDDVSASTLNELLEGVKSWKNKPNVTIIPAQDSATLKQWSVLI